MSSISLANFKKHNPLFISGVLSFKNILFRYGYHCTQASYFTVTDKSWTSKVFHRLRNFQGSNTYPYCLAEKYKVTSVRDLTTGYDNSTPDNKALLPSDPNSEMITFGFENGK